MKHPFIDRLQQHLDAVPVLLSAIAEDILVLRPNPEKWSKKEILGHLVDSAVYNLERFTKIRFCEPPFEIISYPQAELVRANNYQAQDIGNILQLWQALNQQILAVWKNYTEAELQIQIINPAAKNEGNLSWWIEDYTEHLEHHLKQIIGPNYLNIKLWLATPTKAATLLSESDKPFVKLLEHGSMYVEYYAPQGVDLQTPHDQDEVYVIDQGEGIFFNDGIRHTFEAGDVLFVPAGVAHRFEQFSEDFATWVIFYGPKGGEAAIA